MNRRGVPVIVRLGVAVAVVAVVSATAAVALWLFGCSPPRDQSDMVTLYQADPLLAVVPDGGELVDDNALSYTCDSGYPPTNWDGGSPTGGPGFAEV